MDKNLSNLLRDEAKKINNGFCYCDFPYQCFIDEALSYASKYSMPKKDSLMIEREENQTVIKIKPIKGSGKRKPLVIKLWWV